ncbi:probable E3 ubiquitin-protein ligase sinah [Anabrus simplex]|uniref:probable E3 ubiquitin-protein ligase sinah n=1 Tax=Anabrus simplex TaxID=316456 RepID=UPI0035A27F9D
MNRRVTAMSVINLLQCPFCLRPMRPPFFRCPRLHLLCSTCQNSNVVCPECGEWLSGNRSQDTERLALQLPYSCPNDGCPDTRLLAQLTQHTKVCPYRLYDCIPCRPRCRWRGFREDILQHLRDEHPELVWNKSYNSVVYENFDTVTSHSCTHAVLAHGRLFWSHSCRDSDKRLLYEVVQLVGPAEQASYFRFTIEYYRQGKPGKQQVISGLVQPEREDFTAGDCLTVDLRALEEFLNEKKQLFYSLKIDYIPES